MTVKSKKILAGMAACAVISVTSLGAAATIPPEGTTLWAGTVGYGNVNVSSMVKNNSESTSYMKFTECDKDIKLWLTTYMRVNGTKKTASEGVLLPLGNYTFTPTKATKEQMVTIEASREHWLDQALYVEGEWLA